MCIIIHVLQTEVYIIGFMLCHSYESEHVAIIRGPIQTIFGTVI